MRPLVLATAFGCAGCAQLFGIANTTGAADAGAGASLAVTRVSVGATTVTAPQDLTGQTATFYTPDVDPTKLDATPGVLAGNTWTAAVAGTPLVMFTLPAYPMAVTRGLALPAAAQSLDYVVVEHPSPTIADANAMVTVQGTLPSPFATGESLQFYAVGAWVDYGITTGLPPLGTTAVNTTFAYASASSITGRPLEAFTTADRVLLLRYANGVLTAAGQASPLDQSSTTTTVVVNQLAAVTATTTASLALDQLTLGQRFGQTMPPMASSAVSWAAAAEAAPGVFVGPVLQSGTVGATDTSISLAFGNPFATTNHWASALQVVATATRTFTPADPALPATLTASLVQLVDPDTSPTLDFAAGLPTSVSINGTVLTDGAPVSIDPAQAVNVTIAADRTTNTLYQLQLVQLVPNAGNTALDQQVEFTVTGTTPSFTLPPQLFPSGLYTLRAICDAGSYAGAASGDLAMPAFPAVTGSFESGVFTVQ